MYCIKETTIVGSPLFLIVEFGSSEAWEERHEMDENTKRSALEDKDSPIISTRESSHQLKRRQDQQKAPIKTIYMSDSHFARLARKAWYMLKKGMKRSRMSAKVNYLHHEVRVYILELISNKGKRIT